MGFLRLLSYSNKNICRENKNVSFRDVNHKRFAIYYCNVDVKDIIETCTFASMHFEYHSPSPPSVKYIPYIHKYVNLCKDYLHGKIFWSFIRQMETNLSWFVKKKKR